MQNPYHPRALKVRDLVIGRYIRVHGSYLSPGRAVAIIMSQPFAAPTESGGTVNKIRVFRPDIKRGDIWLLAALGLEPYPNGNWDQGCYITDA